MFRPKTMCSVKIAGLLKDKEKIMHLLQKEGKVQPKEISIKISEKENIEKINSKLLLSVTNNLKKIDAITSAIKPQGLFEKYLQAPKKENFLGLDDSSFDLWAQIQIDKLLKKTNSEKQEIEHLKKRIKNTKKKLAILNLLKSQDIPLWDLSKQKRFLIGTAKTENTNLHYLSSLGYVCKIREPKKIKTTSTHVFFIIKKEHHQNALTRLSEIDLFSEAAFNTKPKQAIALLSRKLKENIKALEQRKNALKSLEKERGFLLAVEEKYKNIKERLSSESHMLKTHDVFFLEFWIAKDDIQKIEAIKNLCVLKKTIAKDAPTKLENPPIVRPFESLTRMFALPKYTEFDPTPIIAITFPIFFGIMLTDIAYGFLLFAIFTSIWIKTHNNSLKDFAEIMVLSAISTIFFGFVFGSFFGDFITLGSLMNTYTQPIKIMAFSLLIGFFHINLGLFLKLKEKRDIADTAALIGIELGVFGFMMAYLNVFSGVLVYASFIIFTSSVLFKLRKGYIGFMEMTSFFSSWVSYVRLMALAVATGWLAFAVNLGASFVSAGTGIFAVFVFLVGHAFSFMLNFFSAFVHALRLHYIEFFSQFYEGGGYEFEPLKEEKKFHI